MVLSEGGERGPAWCAGSERGLAWCFTVFWFEFVIYNEWCEKDLGWFTITPSQLAYANTKCLYCRNFKITKPYVRFEVTMILLLRSVFYEYNSYYVSAIEE